MWIMIEINLFDNYIMNVQKVSLVLCVVIILLLVALVLKSRACPCSNLREGFESNGIPNEIMAQIRNIENEINQKLNDHENRISKLENS